MRSLLILAALIVVYSCKQQTPLSAQHIVNQAISSACSGGCDQVAVQFDFRDKHYKSIRNNGLFLYERLFQDSIGRVTDQLRNDGFKRLVNDRSMVIPDSMAFKYSNSVNSVHYFAQLPYGLNDAAAQKEYLGEHTIGDKSYYAIKITFRQEGGGKDFEDEFVYWFATDNYRLEYLAYNYITDGGGVRFREAFNLREINGIWFADYRNYKPADKNTALVDLPEMFLNQQLELLSLIELKEVEVDRDPGSIQL